MNGQVSDIFSRNCIFKSISQNVGKQGEPYNVTTPVQRTLLRWHLGGFVKLAYY